MLFRSLYIDADWTNFTDGSWLIVKCYAVVDPNVYTNAWSDRFLKELATQYLKRQWGQNLSKFKNMQMPGGMSFNGEDIYNQAQQEITRLEHELLRMTIPAMDLIG